MVALSLVCDAPRRDGAARHVAAVGIPGLDDGVDCVELTLLEAQELISSTVSAHRSKSAQQPLVLMKSDGDAFTRAVEQAIGGAKYTVSVALAGNNEQAKAVCEVLARRNGTSDGGSGIPVHVLCSPNVLAIPFVRAILRRSSGCEVRLVEDDLHEAVIVDGRIVLARSAMEQVGGYTSLVTDPATAKTMELLFAGSWAGAIPVAEYLKLGRTLRSDSTRQILEHLRAGHSDNAAAREMGISLRTYRRHVAKIMRDLGANSRFQAGARASELGLLPLHN